MFDAEPTIPIIPIAFAAVQGNLESEWLLTRNLIQQVKRLHRLRRRKAPESPGAEGVGAEVAGGEVPDAPARNRSDRLKQR